MDFGFILNNLDFVATAITVLLGAFGINRHFSNKVNRVSRLIKEVNELILALTEAIKPDPDGKVRIEGDELRRIKRELSEVKGAIRNIKV
ncbi:hypothetical protein DRQ09_08610 [candidate division KSB1 bacterium]|nr:MAG: hypothetical protein DRQ09_08610 [candidate division KSB1 bacterium]